MAARLTVVSGEWPAPGGARLIVVGADGSGEQKSKHGCEEIREGNAKPVGPSVGKPFIL